MNKSIQRGLKVIEKEMQRVRKLVLADLLAVVKAHSPHTGKSPLHPNGHYEFDCAAFGHTPIIKTDKGTQVAVHLIAYSVADNHWTFFCVVENDLGEGDFGDLSPDDFTTETLVDMVSELEGLSTPA
jgi:hypothetical protein